MMRTVFFSLLILAIVFGCQKKVPSTQDAPPAQQISDEPIQKLAREAAQKIHLALKTSGSSTLEILGIESHNIFPPAAFSYFENALVAQLAAVGIQRGSSDWKMKGDLSKQQQEVLFTFRIFKNGESIESGSAQIPDDRQLQNTLAQFGAPEKVQDHSTHVEMPVPTPLAEMKQIPLDVAENCLPDGDCLLLLLYSNELVERNWKDGTERAIPLPATSERSRAPSGKIVRTKEAIFVVSNQFMVPIVFDRNLKQTKGDFPVRLPKPESGLNTFVLSDGRFFDFEEFGSNGLAVIDLKNRLSVAEQGRLVSAEPRVGGTLHASPPYIYASSPSLAGRENDSILKFIYKDGLVQLEKSQNIEGSVYDIVITDLNRDQQREMLVTVRNQRGIFIEVHEPF